MKTQAKLSLKLILIPLILFCLPFKLNAEIYKWVDENGRVHYGDKPTDKASELKLNTEKSGNFRPRAERVERRRELIKSIDEDKQRKKEAHTKKSKQRKRLKRQCVVAKDRLKQFKRAGYLYELDKEGNRNVLSENSKKHSIENLQKQINKHCK